MSAQIIEQDGRPAQLYQRNTWESGQKGGCSACQESAGWVSPYGAGMNYGGLPWAGLIAGIFIGFFLYRSAK